MSDDLITINRVEWEKLLQRVHALEQAVSISPSTELAVVDKPKVKRGTRLHDDWRPSDRAIEQMIEELHVTTGDLVREHRKFVDYFMSAPGQRGVKTDWERAWRNWMRSAAERGHLRGSGRSVGDKAQGWLELNLAEG